LRLFNAIEVDIGAYGALQARESEMKSADFIIAAVNSGLDLPREEHTARLLAALSHPRVAVLNHPTGRVINKREPIDADWPRILRAAAEFGVSLGLSGDPERLDLTDIHCRMAREAGVSIAIGSDAQSGADLDRMGLAVTQARRGWLEAGDVLNTGDADAVFARLQRAPARALKRRKNASVESGAAAMPGAPQ
jgi:DNA polymerase (family 10)